MAETTPRRLAQPAHVADIARRSHNQPPPPIAPCGLVTPFRMGSGFSGCCRSGTKSVEAPPGKRLMLGYFMIDLSKSRITGSDQRQDPAVVLDPNTFPAMTVSTRAGAAPLKTMSYFSYGSIVRL